MTPDDEQYNALLKLLKAQSVLKTQTVPQKESITQQLRAYKENAQARVQTLVTHVPSLTPEFVTLDYDRRKHERVEERLRLLEGLLLEATPNFKNLLLAFPKIPL